MHFITGEPTLAQQAALLIAALDLGSVSYSVPKSSQPRVFSNATNRISRRSITAICGSPSTQICTQSE